MIILSAATPQQQEHEAEGSRVEKAAQAQCIDLGQCYAAPGFIPACVPNLVKKICFPTGFAVG
jgi:hypothetical protein